MHYALFDGNRCITQAHRLDALQQEYGESARRQFDDQVQHNETVARDNLNSWDFGALPASVKIRQAGQTIRAYPALVDYEDSVAIELFETETEARFYHASGIARLYFLQLGDSIKYLNKNLPEIEASALMYTAIGSRGELIADLLLAAVFACFLADKLPTTRTKFEQNLEKNRNGFIDTAKPARPIVSPYLDITSELTSGFGRLRFARTPQAGYAKPARRADIRRFHA